MFKNKELNNALDENKSTFENNKSMMDNISSDIRELEKYLKELCISVPFGFHIEDDKYICWELFEEQKIFRILFYDWHTNFCKPLIECKLNIRIMCNDFLPKFLREFAVHINNKE